MSEAKTPPIEDPQIRDEFASSQDWLAEIVDEFRQIREKCERAAAQVDDKDFFATGGLYPLSVGLLMKHVGGNFRSRWRDFLSTDGEKADRLRDLEFIVEAGETRATIEEKWRVGWTIAFEALESLEPADLGRTITIRGEPHTVTRAIHRSLTHASYHGGQIVLLARHFAGDAWQTLSVAPGKTEEHNAEMRERYGDWL